MATVSKTLLGTYVGTLDDTNAAAQAGVTAQYNTFVSAMGQGATVIDTYIDNGVPESQWAGDAQWAADSMKAASWAANMIPCIGLPMAYNGESADQAFQNIASGSEDSVFNGIFQAFANDGYKQFYIRPGFEMNGNWDPWSVTAANAADFVAAFQRIAALAHAFTGATIQVVWNPNVGSTPVPISQLYPGNSAVDVVGLDSYGEPVNYDASPSDNSTSSSDITLQDVLALAKANNKPFALPETGGTDATFPALLASTIAASGVPVAFMNIWDANGDYGNLSWSAPADNAAAAAAAWKQAYATIAAASVAGTTTPVTPPVTVTPSANDTVVLAGSSAHLTDASGNLWTVTSGNQVAVNGVADTTTSNVAEIAYVNGEVWHENTSGVWYGKTSPTAAWAYSGTSPLPATTPPPVTITPSANDTVVLAGSSAGITDASGNVWTITSGQVAVNGVPDTTTSNVAEIAYVNGEVWHENTSGVWYGKTSPTAAWAYSGTSPLPAVTKPPLITPSANDTVVLAGSSAGITDASGNLWTITSGEVAVNGVPDTTTSNVAEIAYVNGEVWHKNTSGAWYGKTSPTAAWAYSGTSPLPATTPPPVTITTSPNDTMVLAGASAHITDASGNAWTITSGNQVAVNGITDTTTYNVAELVYAGKKVWHENTSGAWYDKTSPTAAWAYASASPLPAPVTIAAGQASTTVSQSQIQVAATAGTHLLFISGSGDIVNLSGAADKITDTGSGNTYIIPAAGHGSDTFTSNVLARGDTLDLKPALAATTWTGTAATLSTYLKVTDTASGAVVGIASNGGAAVTVATIDGATGTTLSSLMAHAIV